MDLTRLQGKLMVNRMNPYTPDVLASPSPLVILSPERSAELRTKPRRREKNLTSAQGKLCVAISSLLDEIASSR